MSHLAIRYCVAKNMWLGISNIALSLMPRNVRSLGLSAWHHARQTFPSDEQFGFRKGRVTRYATGLLLKIGKRYLEEDIEVYVAFVDLEETFDSEFGANLWGSWRKLVCTRKVGGS